MRKQSNVFGSTAVKSDDDDESFVIAVGSEQTYVEFSKVEYISAPVLYIQQTLWYIIFTSWLMSNVITFKIQFCIPASSIVLGMHSWSSMLV